MSINTTIQTERTKIRDKAKPPFKQDPTPTKRRQRRLDEIGRRNRPVGWPAHDTGEK